MYRPHPSGRPACSWQLSHFLPLRKYKCKPLSLALQLILGYGLGILGSELGVAILSSHCLTKESILSLYASKKLLCFMRNYSISQSLMKNLSIHDTAMSTVQMDLCTHKGHHKARASARIKCKIGFCCIGMPPFFYLQH